VWQNATNLQILDDAQWGTRKMCCDERPNALAIVVVLAMMTQMNQIFFMNSSTYNIMHVKS
jgi:hypothetical protein